MNFLRKIAPFLSTALSFGGPVGTIAGKALTTVLGTTSSKPEDIAAALAGATPEQIAGLQQAEQAFQVQMKQLDIQSVDELEKMGNDDRASARQMQVQTKSYLPSILAIIVTAGFLGLLAGMMFGKLKVSDNQALLLLLGALSGSFTTVIAFYFGSSAGSDRKTELMASANGTQPAAPAAHK